MDVEADEVVPWRKALAAKTESLSLISGDYIHGGKRKLMAAVYSLIP